MYKKYPKTFHLPWSDSLTKDDKRLNNTNLFNNMNVIVTEKLDGECTTMYKDKIHARSIDSISHSSRGWIKAFHSKISWIIPKNIRIVGENMFAKHSIFYNRLTSYFYVFAVFKIENNIDICCNLCETVYWANRIGAKCCPILYRGTWNKEKIKSCWNGESSFGPISEGYVVRNVEEFLFDDFNKNVAKYVRKNHVQTNYNWMNQKVIRNELK